ncbi:response regulator [Candidatus Dojkabacteria bacterium]|nr:response regulator [Candidatus Dojkabacteria bacterium]
MRALVIDDDKTITKLVEQSLKSAGFAVDIALDGQKGLELAKIESSNYDVIIIDVLLPVIDGLTICEKLRESEIDVPIMLLSSRDHVEDKVKGLELGADDYLGKPFNLEELTARVKALSRRSALSRKRELSVKDIFISADKQIARVGDVEVHLTPIEFRILFLLLEKFESVISRAEILDKVWDSSGENVFSNTVDVHIKNLRDKLEEAKSALFIEAVREIGYKAV